MKPRVTLVGGLKETPKVNKTTNGNSVANFQVACSEHVNGEKDTKWYNVVAWKQVADYLATYGKAGTKVLINGTLDVRKNEYNGQTRYITEIIANLCEIVSQPNGDTSVKKTDIKPEDLSEELPF